MNPGAIAGIFVGGFARRMHGRPKGLLPSPEGGTLVERWRDLLGGLGLRVVLVGESAPYAAMGMDSVKDDPQGIGPLGGLVALLKGAGACAEEATVLAFACDMPFVSRALVGRLISFESAAPIVAPRRDGRWEPLCARYDAGRVLHAAVARVASPGHSLQGLLDDLGAEMLPLSDGEARQLDDWDSPEDLAAPP